MKLSNLLIFTPLLLTIATAATFTWDGASSNSNWTSANWTGASVPNSNNGEFLVFAGTNKLSNVANNGQWTVAGLQFATNAGAFNLSGGGLYVGSSGIENLSSNTATISNQFTLQSAQTWNATNGNIVTSSQINAQNYALTLAGNKDITINQVSNGGNLTFTGAGNRTTAGLYLSSNTLQINNTGTNTYGQVQAGTTNITANSTNKFLNSIDSANMTISNGTNTFTGQATANTKFDILGGTNTFNASVSANTVLNVASSNATTFNQQVNSGVVNISSNNTNVTFATTLNANNGLNISGNSAVTIGNQLNANAGLNISSGSLVVAGTTNASNGITVSGSGSFTASGQTNASSINLSTSGDTTFSGTVNTQSLLLTGTGTTTLDGSSGNSIQNTTVNNGTLILDKSAGQALTGSVTVNGGTIEFAQNNQISNFVTITLNSGSTLLLGDTLQSFAGIVVTGDSVIDFAGSSSTLNISQLSVNAGVNLTILNWNAATDHFYTSNQPNNAVLGTIVYDGYGPGANWSGVGGITPTSPVPEPSTYGAIMSAFIGLLYFLRRQTHLKRSILDNNASRTNPTQN